MKYKTRRVIVLIAYVVVLFTALLLSPAGTSDMHAKARGAYLRRLHSVGEGPITNFHPMRYSGIRTSVIGFSANHFVDALEYSKCLNIVVSSSRRLRQPS